MLKVLVLGGNGFTGKHLVKALSPKNNIRLTIFSRQPIVEPHPGVHFIVGDFTDSKALEAALQGQQVVYHLVSETIPAKTWTAPLLEIEKNLVPFLKFIELCANYRIQKVCFTSSGGTVYGMQDRLLAENSPTLPFSPYGIVKRTIESFLQYAETRYGISYDIFRISNVYGEGQNIGKGLGFINTALENIVNHRPVTIYGDGSVERDYIYVKDVAQLLTLSVSQDISKSGIYNISSNHSISLNNLTSVIKQTLNIDFDVKYVSSRQSDNKKVLLDNTKIMNFFDTFTFTSLTKGIKNTYSYLKHNIE